MPTLKLVALLSLFFCFPQSLVAIAIGPLPLGECHFTAAHDSYGWRNEGVGGVHVGETQSIVVMAVSGAASLQYFGHYLKLPYGSSGSLVLMVSGPQGGQTFFSRQYLMIRDGETVFYFMWHDPR